MTDVTPHEATAVAPRAVVAEAPDVSDSEVSSLCGSELELEMAWGEGPIAPLRTDAAATDDGVRRSLSAGRTASSGRAASSRARTPQRRGAESPVPKSKRLINIHPIRSAAYLAKPNELPLGVRKQQRWFNDHHFGNRAASTRLEDLMEHMDINVEWRSNFQKLAEPQNERLQEAFREGRGGLAAKNANQLRSRRKDGWDVAEQMFSRVDRRARTLMLRSFHSFAPFIEAVEYVVLHFIQWREVPSELEVASPLFRLLAHPIELLRASEKDVRLVLPLLDSAFHRLIIHSVCQFYGVRSRTEANRRLGTKIMVLKSPKKGKTLLSEMVTVSLCDFIRETRVAKRPSAAEMSPEKENVEGSSHPLELQSKSSECSDGFYMVEAPQM